MERIKDRTHLSETKGTRNIGL